MTYTDRDRWLMSTLMLAWREFADTEESCTWDALIRRAMEYGGRGTPPPKLAEYQRLRNATVKDLFARGD